MTRQVFSRGLGTTPSQEFCRASEINVPVRLQTAEQEAWVHPGDYIVADANGVVCLPKVLAERVLELLPGIVEADEKVANDIRNGVPVADAFARHRGK